MRGALNVDTLKYFIVIFLLFVFGILEAHETLETKEQPVEKNATQKTDGRGSSERSSHQSITSTPYQLFTQVFIDHRLQGEYDLIKAVVRGDWNKVRFLVTIGADVNIQDKDMPFWSWSRISGWTPLLYVIRRRDLDMARFLVESGADVNQKNRYGWTALMEAAENNDKEGIEFLKEFDVDVNQQNKYGVTALIEAVRAGSLEAAQLLIDLGADVDLSNEYDTTALIMAAITGRMKFVELLISSGANVHLRDNGGWSALMYAHGFFPKIAQLLEEKGAKLTLEDQQKLSHKKKKCTLSLL